MRFLSYGNTPLNGDKKLGEGGWLLFLNALARADGMFWRFGKFANLIMQTNYDGRASQRLDSLDSPLR